MTGLERCMTVLQGGVADRVPVVPQAFLFAARTAGYKIGQICKDAAKLAKSHVICQEKYGYDGCVIDVDDATLAAPSASTGRTKLSRRMNTILCSTALRHIRIWSCPIRSKTAGCPSGWRRRNGW
jgi:hypothetical protein